MRKPVGLSLVAVMLAAVGVSPVLIATAATSSPAPSPLEGTWIAPAATCEQQNAALARAGLGSEDLDLAGWDEATCGGMMHGSQQTLRFSGDRLVLLQDDVVGWDGAYRIIDESTFEAGGDPGIFDITYAYTLDGDELTIDMVDDDFGLPPEELAGELVAITAIYETTPFTRDRSADLPYALDLPEGWIAATEADAYRSADGTITLTIGTGRPEPGQTVEDRVRDNRESEDFADCVTDPSLDRPVTVGGESGILWSFVCGDDAGVAANTIHEALGYRLTIRAPADAVADLEPLMAEILSGFAFSD